MTPYKLLLSSFNCLMFRIQLLMALRTGDIGRSCSLSLLKFNVLKLYFLPIRS